jgi:hypothetical protein
MTMKQKGTKALSFEDLTNLLTMLIVDQLLN